MPKENIAFISLLKPVDDIRSYHKLALSLLKVTQAPLHLIGYPSQSLPTPPDQISFHSFSPFRRLSWKRLWAPKEVFEILFRLKPQLIVVNSPELLLVTVFCKILFGSRIVYDIQENYFRNLWYQRVFPPLIKHVLAIAVRMKELLLSPFFDHFILAEESYSKELNFIGQKYTILENKTLQAVRRIRNEHHPRPQILFSGTITRNTGIYRALELKGRLNEHMNVTLRVVGHCPDKKFYDHLMHLEDDSLSLHISTQPLPYRDIEEAIRHSDAGLICYETNPSNAHCMPTKVYEYAASGLPLIYEKGSHWHGFIDQETKGFAMDLKKINRKKLESFIHSCEDRSLDRPSDKALWLEEENKWHKCIAPFVN